MFSIIDKIVTDKNEDRLDEIDRSLIRLDNIDSIVILTQLFSEAEGTNIIN